MTRHRIVAVIGTRPEVVKMAPVVRLLREQPWADVRVVATAQHRELLDRVAPLFELAFDRDLDAMRPDQSLADLTARLLTALDPVLVAERPRLVLAQGDTTTVMATALACSNRGIPFAHVEAGLRTGDFGDPFPEERNRVLVARLAALHFAPTAGARQNLLHEGVPPPAVTVTGNTVVDALQWAAPRAPVSPFAAPPGRHLVLVTAHRRESFGAPMVRVCAALRELAARADVAIVWPLHPNPAVGDVVRRELGRQPAIRLEAPLDYLEMIGAMRAATLILTDSGGVQEEAPSLGKPVLVLRDKTERPEGVAAGVATLVGTDAARIVAATTRLLDDPGARAAMAAAVNPYGDGRAAPRIVAALREHLGA